jgi:hypothetical protein
MQSQAYSAAEQLQTLMVARATSEQSIPKADYRDARKSLLSDPAVKDTGIERLVPSFVRSCTSPDAFWSYIRGVASGSGSWDARSRHIYEAFGPLLVALERLDASPADDTISEAVSRFGAESVSDAWRKALERREQDPSGAITAARTLIESVCKSLLDEFGPREEYDSDDLPKLYSKLSKELRLAPAEHTDRELKRILQGCVSIVSGLGAVRNREGDSHGKGRRSYQPGPRHAALAVNVAGSMALFLLETSDDLRAHYEEMADDADGADSA